MDRTRPQLLKQITMADWNAKAHPDVPPLPWVGDRGEHSTVTRLLETGGLLIVLFDADGREGVRSGSVHAIEATALALRAVAGDVMLCQPDRAYRAPAAGRGLGDRGPCGTGCQGPW